MGASSSLLYTLLRLTTRPQQTPVTDSGPVLRPVPPDALGYFLSLLATTPTRTAYWKLLRESGAGSGWLPEPGTEEDERVPIVPRVALDLLGIQDHHTAVLITSFLGSMLNSAGAEPEREILFSLIADISAVYPDVVTMAYGSPLLIECLLIITADMKASRIEWWKPLQTSPTRPFFTLLASSSARLCLILFGVLTSQ
jgi:hypothetical protein